MAPGLGAPGSSGLALAARRAEVQGSRQRGLSLPPGPTAAGDCPLPLPPQAAPCCPAGHRVPSHAGAGAHPQALPFCRRSGHRSPNPQDCSALLFKLDVANQGAPLVVWRRTAGSCKAGARGPRARWGPARWLWAGLLKRRVPLAAAVCPAAL